MRLFVLETVRIPALDRGHAAHVVRSQYLLSVEKQPRLEVVQAGFALDPNAHGRRRGISVPAPIQPNVSERQVPVLIDKEIKLILEHRNGRAVFEFSDLEFSLKQHAAVPAVGDLYAEQTGRDRRFALKSARNAIRDNFGRFFGGV